MAALEPKIQQPEKMSLAVRTWLTANSIPDGRWLFLTKPQLEKIVEDAEEELRPRVLAILFLHGMGYLPYAAGIAYESWKGDEELRSYCEKHGTVMCLTVWYGKNIPLTTAHIAAELNESARRAAKRADKSLTEDELSDLDVSDEEVRKQLDELQQRGWCQRTDDQGTALTDHRKTEAGRKYLQGLRGKSCIFLYLKPKRPSPRTEGLPVTLTPKTKDLSEVMRLSMRSSHGEDSAVAESENLQLLKTILTALRPQIGRDPVDPRSFVDREDIRARLDQYKQAQGLLSEAAAALKDTVEAAVLERKPAVSAKSAAPNPTSASAVGQSDPKSIQSGAAAALLPSAGGAAPGSSPEQLAVFREQQQPIVSRPRERIVPKNNEPHVPKTGEELAPVFTALAKYCGPQNVDMATVKRLFGGCRDHHPDCTVAEVEAFVHASGTKIDLHNKRSPARYLSTAVETAIEGPGLLTWREQQARGGPAAPLPPARAAVEEPSLAKKYRERLAGGGHA